jgi:superfamily II DNA or RNA helicase
MQPRPYQQQSVTAILKEWENGNRRTMLVLPTGTGKTIVFCLVIEECVRRGGRVLVLAHRGELLDQAADKLRASTGLACAIEKAQQTCIGKWERVTVGSIQSLMRQNRLDRFPRDYFDAVIVDETHHVLAESYQRVLDHFESANVLGVTATPDRGDRKNLGQYFDSMAYEYTLAQAINEGYLARIKALTVPLDLDISSVKQQGGDFQAAGVATALDPYLEQIADTLVKHCSDRRTVIFLPLIATAQKLKAMLLNRGVSAAEVNGESHDRKQVLMDFESGRYKFMCNAMLLTEGWDCPPVDCVVVLRPTKVRSLYCQMVGRGTRLFPGKDHLLLLDFLWHSERHELCRPAHLICGSDEVAQRMTKNLEESAGHESDIEEAEQQAVKDAVAEREEALLRQLQQHRDKKSRLVDPLQYELSINAEDLINYEPQFAWEMAAPSKSQIETLQKLGIASSVESAGKAAQLIDRLVKRRAVGMATPKQIRFLEQRGFQHVGTWNAKDAGRMISRISMNGWKVPHSVNPSSYQPEPAMEMPA